MLSELLSISTSKVKSSRELRAEFPPLELIVMLEVFVMLVLMLMVVILVMLLIMTVGEFALALATGVVGVAGELKVLLVGVEGGES